ncbi:MAG: hypothetical protein KatS3mg111_3362 [Pirellulaceae bacterium]|nr:MAG: hypothetical protein KatS3mg111_3362 [Pirellulaceae bacterium]
MAPGCPVASSLPILGATLASDPITIDSAMSVRHAISFLSARVSPDAHFPLARGTTLAMHSSRLTVVVLCGLVAVTVAHLRGAERIDFSRDILPLLSDRCFLCHGPDEGTREAGMRLDVAEEAYEYAIVPGRPEESPLIERIFSEDPDLVMPPPSSNLSLTPAQRELLRNWVAQGAPYQQHWAFVAPQRHPLPVTVGIGPLNNAIDAFVGARLLQEGLPFSPPADRATLLRRLSLDLTGLPPTAEQVAAFLTDTSPGALERVVDRLLASPRFGERLAVDWLDAARYADTYGYQNDRYRAVWPWRDWVIEALNNDLPYDQFITWQIAGDLLPQATREQILATAFNRLHRQTNEGGSVEEEFRQEYVADRVNTFGAAFLGMTLECARCHDHKYDPISQREYYQLAAFFNSIDESGLYSHFTEATPTPTLLLPTADQEAVLAQLASQFDNARKAVRRFRPNEAVYASWRSGLSDVGARAPLAELPPAPQLSLADQLEQGLRAVTLGHFSFDEAGSSQTVTNLTDTTMAGKLIEGPVATEGVRGQGLRFSGDNGMVTAVGGEFTRNDRFAIVLWLNVPREYDRAVVLHRSRAWTDSGSRGYELLIEDGRLSAALIHFWPGNAVRVRTRQKLPLDRWVHVAMVYDGSWQAEGLQLLVDGRQVAVDVVRDQLTKHIIGSDGFPGGDVRELALAHRFRDKGLKDGRIDELRVFSRDLSRLEVAYLRAVDLGQPIDRLLAQVTEEELAEHFRTVSAHRHDLVEHMQRIGRELAALRDPIPEIMVMREMDKPRETFLLTRGAYDQPAERVERDFPTHLFADFPNDQPTDDRLDRLDLARWLCHPRHPLTARVVVNRVWQTFFGRGLVETCEDFGVQGTAPTHPQLLDWLAMELIESDWDLKHLVRLIVTSRTYGQRSHLTPELLARDPQNLLLARGPAVRLSAEVVRDSALAASGLLVLDIGGPPVKPYQPPGLWKEKSGEEYRRQPGAASHRRSLYTFWKRTSPPPSMMAFDAGTREVCMVRRQSTLTPMQTLVLWNDPQFLEAAVALAARAIEVHADPDQQLKQVFQALVSRQPTARELAVIAAMLEEQMDELERLSDADQQIDALLNIGDYRPPHTLSKLHLAALALVANGLMNYDEVVMKR